MSESLKSCCRICLDVESDHVPIFEDATITLHLKVCLGITLTPNDALPKSICTTCVAQLSEFYNFILNARCSQDWLESSIQEKSKKVVEKPPIVQPLPDSEYNSDSLLEFLNNTENIEEYLNNLGKEDIPCIVNMLDRNTENSMDGLKNLNKSMKHPSPKKKDITTKNCNINMEIDVLDSDIEIVKEILLKETEPKKTVVVNKVEKNFNSCFSCKIKFDSIQKLSQHLSVCDTAQRTCVHCNTLFDSKLRMQQHSVKHNLNSLTCNCGKQFSSKEQLQQHHKVCYIDYTAMMGCTFKCKECGVIFKERFQLYRHAKDHIMKAEERICDICGHIFIGNEALTRHKKDEHEKSENLFYRCKICRHTSPSHKELYIHVRKHIEKPESDRHLCETCGQSFTTNASLIRHSHRHANMKHKCTICNRLFTNAKARDEHILEHVELTICEKCGQSISSYKLEMHNCS